MFTKFFPVRTAGRPLIPVLGVKVPIYFPSSCIHAIP